MKNIAKYLGLLIIPLFILAVSSCDKDNYDPNPSEQHLTYVTNIKLVLGGVEIAGKMNENKKEIIFPKLPANTNLSAVSFKGDFPSGAKFENDTYDFTPDEGNASTKRTIAVVNSTRKREYFVTINLSVPPTGAGFLEAIRYNFSQSAVIYPGFMDVGDARAADIDLEHVLIVGRNNVPHLLALNELKQGIINPVHLDQTGVSGGTFARNAGRMQHGHIYICNLTTGFATSSFKVYHWDKSRPQDPPTVIADYLMSDVEGAAAGVRYGDFMSMDIDQDGNGYIFSKAGGSHATTLRIKVTNFTQTSEPTILAIPELGAWSTYNEVEGASGEYLYTGHQGGIRLMNLGGVQQYAMTTFGATHGGGARIVTFNQERYLITIDDQTGAGNLRVYNVTKGATIREALEIFDGGDAAAKAPLISQSLGGAIPAANNAVCVNWAKDGNNKLYILGAATTAGFVIFELNQASETDPFDSFETD
ncbi:MAG: DUF4623 domain-containing protein [Bacteroidales bacterium]|nr:DUF4623 domain-containing protein [Bacteroidales bacterium]